MLFSTDKDGGGGALTAKDDIFLCKVDRSLRKWGSGGRFRDRVLKVLC